MGKNPKSSVSGENKKTGESKGGNPKTEIAVSPSGKSALLRKLARRNSVTSVRNMEVLIQPIILGTVRSTMQVELSKHGSNLERESPTGMRTSHKSSKMVLRKYLKPLRRILKRLLEK